MIITGHDNMHLLFSVYIRNCLFELLHVVFKLLNGLLQTCCNVIHIITVKAEEPTCEFQC